MDSLLSIVQMPAGIPVATFAIGNAGAANAGAVRRRDAGARRIRRSRDALAAVPRAPDRRRRSTTTIRASDSSHDDRRHPRRRAAGAHARAFRRAARPALPGDGHRRRCLRRPVRADDGRRLPRRGARWPNSPSQVDVATFDFENVPAESRAVAGRTRAGVPEPARAGRRAGPARGKDAVPRTRHRRCRRSRRSTPRDDLDAALAHDRRAVHPQDAPPGLRRQGPVPHASRSPMPMPRGTRSAGRRARSA